MKRNTLFLLLMWPLSLVLAQNQREYLDADFHLLKSARNAAYFQYASYDENHQLNGPIHIYYADSTLYMEGYYYQGKRYGKFVWYYPNSIIKQQGAYAADRQIGEWFTYLKDGQQDEFDQFDAYGNLTSTYPNDESIFGYVEDWPKWPGCEKLKSLEDQRSCSESKRQEYLDKVPFPAEVTDHTDASVNIYCIVDKNGKTFEIHTTLTSGNPLLDKAAEDWVRNMPLQLPGTWHGKQVKVQLNLVVHFHQN